MSGAYLLLQVNDFVGWIAGRLEWWVLWLAAADDKGFLSKEKVRSCGRKDDVTLLTLPRPDSCHVRRHALGCAGQGADCEARL